MPELEASSASSSKGTSASLPWWVRLCRWLWKVTAFLGISVILSLLVNVSATWLTSPKGRIPPDSPFGWLLAHWPITLLIGGGFLFVAVLTGVVSHRQHHPTRLLSPSQQNRARMLRRLHHSYSDLLAHSLQGAIRMDMGLSHRPDAVHNASNLLLHLPNRPGHLLPPGTPIIHAYDEAAHELLILGEPGAGKSTLLLDLAQQLVARAEQDEAHPLPVILPLSSWAVKRPSLQDWLCEQLAQIYDVPERLSRQWVQEERLLPLLDGLDEMEASARTACITAINAYHHDTLAPLVVCSRTAEYDVAARQHRLTLQSAVMVEPLTLEQVDAYLVLLGKPLAALRSALKKQSALQELATTPLMLTILILTYQGTSLRRLSQVHARLQQQVWTDYVQRMVERKGNARRYPLEQTRSWLGWLARQMRVHNQTIFYAEHLQSDWLTSEQQHAYTWLGIRLPAIIIGIIAAVLVWIFLINGTDFVSLNQVGLLGGFLGGWFSQHGNTNPVSSGDKTSAKSHGRGVMGHRALSSFLLGLLYPASFGLFLSADYTPGDWLRDVIIFGLLIGLSGWVVQSLLPRTSIQPVFSPGQQKRFRFRLPEWFKTRHGRRAVLGAAILGAGIGLSYGLSEGLRLGLSLGLRYGLSEGLRYGLSFGLISLFINVILDTNSGILPLAERLNWNGRHLTAPRHLRTSVLVGSLTGLLVGLSDGLIYGLSDLGDGQSLWQSYGLSYGLSLGLSIGLSIGLSYWLLLGLYQGIVQKHLEDHDRRSFNQGIRRSLRNSTTISLLSGAIIAIIGILSIGLSYGLSYGLSGGLSYGLSLGLRLGLREGLLLAIGGGLLVWVMVGGLTVLQHYVLRLLLAHSHIFPWRAQAFLDDATSRILLRRVGGGYSFVHRLLLDHFAATNASPSEALAMSGAQNATPQASQEGSSLQPPSPPIQRISP